MNNHLPGNSDQAFTEPVSTCQTSPLMFTWGQFPKNVITEKDTFVNTAHLPERLWMNYCGPETQLNIAG